MAKEKDPAFLFYSKDWLQGTAGLMPDEKGVYIDLLAHQHQNGHLPEDVKRLARMVGLSQNEFDAIWINLKSKFTSIEGNHMVNQRLTKVVTKRATTAHTKAIAGKFAVLIRGISHYPETFRNEIKDNFQMTDFEPFELEEAYSRLTIWFTKWITKALANANATVIGNEIKEGVIGEGLIYDVEKYLLDHQAEFEAAVGVKPGTTAAKGKEILKKYHLWVKSKEGYPKHSAALVAGFQTWILNEKNSVNGTYRNGHQSPTAGGQDPNRIGKEGIGSL